MYLPLDAAPFEKSLWIVLVRDVDGKTFWDALNEAITPRLKTLNSIDEAAISTFRNIFQGRDLKKGTNIFLTWPEPSKMLVSLLCNIYFILNIETHTMAVLFLNVCYLVGCRLLSHQKG